MSVKIPPVKILQNVKNRLLRLTEEKPNNHGDCDDGMLLTYGDQRNAYFYDYLSSEYSVEGSVSCDYFRCTDYSSSSTREIFTLKISTIPSSLEEGEFFQLSLIEDLGELNYKQLLVILEIRDIMRKECIVWETLNEK